MHFKISGEKMPVKYVCRNCGFVLWEFREVGQDYYGVPTPEEVIRVYGGICPRCKSDLRMPSLNDISIKIMRTRLTISDIESRFELRSTSILSGHLEHGKFMAAQEA